MDDKIGIDDKTEKGAAIRTFICGLYFYSINLNLPPGQLFELYFSQEFMALAGKSPKWGLDRIQQVSQISK
ncbi:MAG: hypothetical protein ABSB87_21480, partial [Terriglobales bacterium]